MIRLRHIQDMIVGKRSYTDVWYYIQGEYRVKLFYSKRWKWLLQPHIIEQIEARIGWMDKECYEMGACKICGCETIALQCADKQCDKPCYPPMMSEKNWNQFMHLNKAMKFEDGSIWCYNAYMQKPILLLKKSEKK